jgi:hypothetical protein
MENDVEYFTRRAVQERRAASSSVHPRVRECHLQLAEMYEHRVRLLRADERRSGAHLTTAA